jgi:hypothetical protein
MDDMDILAIKAHLARRVAAIDWRAGPARLAPELDGIRIAAEQHQLLPVVTVAQSLGCAIGRGERGVLVHDWLGLLGEAVASGAQDEATSRAFAAACAVRLAA